MENGSIKIGAGDMISTGSKSRIKIYLPDNSYMALGSNSRLVLSDPCNLNPTESDVSIKTKIRMLAGKILYYLGDQAGGFEVKTGTAVVGVRGQITPGLNEYYYRGEIKHGGLSFDFQDKPVVNDPEKVSLIGEAGNLKDSHFAFYIHSDAKGVYEISALHGNLEVESTYKLKKMEVFEGASATSWPDGSPFNEIYVRTAKK